MIQARQENASLKSFNIWLRFCQNSLLSISQKLCSILPIHPKRFDPIASFANVETSPTFPIRNNSHQMVASYGGRYMFNVSCAKQIQTIYQTFCFHPTDQRFFRHNWFVNWSAAVTAHDADPIDPSYLHDMIIHLWSEIRKKQPFKCKCLEKLKVEYDLLRSIYTNHKQQRDSL